MLVPVSVKVADRDDGSTRWAELARYPNWMSAEALWSGLFGSGAASAPVKVEVFPHRDMDDHRSEARLARSLHPLLGGKGD